MSLWASGDKITAVRLNADTKNSLTLKNSGTALFIKPSSDPAANTKMLELQNDAATSVFSVDLEGDVIVGGTWLSFKLNNTTANIDLSADGTTAAGTWHIMSIMVGGTAFLKLVAKSDGVGGFAPMEVQSIEDFWIFATGGMANKDTATAVANYDSYPFMLTSSAWDAGEVLRSHFFQEIVTDKDNYKLELYRQTYPPTVDTLLLTMDQDGAVIMKPQANSDVLTIQNTTPTDRIALGVGSAGNRGVLKMWDATLAAWRYAYIDNNVWAIAAGEPT